MLLLRAAGDATDQLAAPAGGSRKAEAQEGCMKELVIAWLLRKEQTKGCWGRKPMTSGQKIKPDGEAAFTYP